MLIGTALKKALEIRFHENQNTSMDKKEIEIKDDHSLHLIAIPLRSIATGVLGVRLRKSEDKPNKRMQK